MCRRIWCGYFNLSVPWSDTFVRAVYGYYISDSNYSEFPNISIFNLSIAKNLRSRLFLIRILKVIITLCPLPSNAQVNLLNTFSLVPIDWRRVPSDLSHKWGSILCPEYVGLLVIQSGIYRGCLRLQ